MKTYLFYDTETSGLNPSFDQILTFAGIRTDTNFKEIDRYSITIRLRKDIVPSPKAFITHGLSFNELSGGIDEYDAALKIHQIVNTADTISFGYNSLNFDDEFLRFMFYRNLLDPYSHQYKDGCGRMDALPLTVIYRVFNPECLKWPELNGKSSLKLDLIASENAFITQGRAHEAMNDVEALIELCKRLCSADKDIWCYCLDFFNKSLDSQRINNIQSNFTIANRAFKTGIMVSLPFGAKLNYLAPVIYIGQSIPYSNQSLWMRLDTKGSKEKDEKAAQKEKLDLSDLPIIRKKFGDELFILPPLERFKNKLSESSRQSANENLQKIRQDSENFFEIIKSHLEYRYPDIPDIDPDAALYQEGFFSSREKMQCSLFHQTENNRKYTVLDQLDNGRIKTLAGRILYRNSLVPDEMPDQERVSPPNDNSVKGYKGDTKFSCGEGIEELDEIEKLSLNLSLNLNQNQKNIVVELREYIEKLRQQQAALQ